MEIKRSSSQPSGKAEAEDFTGAVRIDPLFEPTNPARAGASVVTFEPGARTGWHAHPLGQTSIVTTGSGRVQRWGGPVEPIQPADVISIAPGEKHWHGAAPATAMAHVAIQERLDGTSFANGGREGRTIRFVISSRTRSVTYRLRSRAACSEFLNFLRLVR
jgi:quercetin dioxygenase-like cupin family protein